MLGKQYDPPNQETIEQVVTQALVEDIGTGDLTTQWTIPHDLVGTARVLCRQKAVVCGAQIVEEVYRQIDPSLQISWMKTDGQVILPNATLLTLTGKLASVWTGERVALNFLGRLSGIASLTRKYVQAVEGTSATILSTRKTTPLLRVFEKYAVRAGGGANHRFGLYDMVLIKENHIGACGGVVNALAAVHRYCPEHIKIEVEVEHLYQLEQVIQEGAYLVMLDNMNVDDLCEAVRIANGRVKLEASGGITLDTVRQVAETGVDYISVGALTHSAPCVDFSMRLEHSYCE